MNVLVVESNKAVSLIICRIIEELGHRYVLAADGEAALRLYHQRDIGLLILDVELPILDGFTVAQDVRNGNAAIPILFISKNNSEACLQQCVDAGGDTLMPKPLRPSVLRAWLYSRLTPTNPSTQLSPTAG
ncbi:MAG: chemotaxis protein CheY [Alcanivorax borkumensis]|jgi:DNA-binding response OmpR family regulator|nr:MULTISPECIES: response regulator [Alcanivorax]EUC70376.1 chemotaxis protein CheY [Alcanivorax sp. 97CO-5]OJH08281.1 MAG: chemotaxis protein CheY [Alcanivorax borkumensis]PKG02046.1 response regulator [Alcanivorax sp. 97CO-6]BAP14468.1 DNA-binding response regulator OmpR [Alcanivorax sp. NBRC 101098]